jgi:hypothetical protein
MQAVGVILLFLIIYHLIILGMYVAGRGRELDKNAKEESRSA